MKHFYRIPILAAALLITVASAALAGQKNSTTPQKTSWFSSAAPTAPKFKPASPARSARPAESAKSNGQCTIASCVKLIGVGL